MNALSQIKIDRADKACAIEAIRKPLRQHARSLSDEALAQMMFVLVEEVNRRLPDDIDVSEAIDAINDEIASFVGSVDSVLFHNRYQERFS